jgi:hypothetical protein
MRWFQIWSVAYGCEIEADHRNTCQQTYAKKDMDAAKVWVIEIGVTVSHKNSSDSNHAISFSLMKNAGLVTKKFHLC